MKYRAEITVAIIFLIFLFCIPIVLEQREHKYAQYYSKEIYTLWIKLTNRSDFTYEEWVAARKAGLITIPVVNYSNINKERVENEN